MCHRAVGATARGIRRKPSGVPMPEAVVGLSALDVNAADRVGERPRTI